MNRHLVVTVLLSSAVIVSAAEPVTFEQADTRLRRAYALAEEMNDPPLLTRVLDLRDRVKGAFDRKDTAAAERLIRDAEVAVGLDPGGKTMRRLPVAQVTPAMGKELEALDGRLAEAMKKGDPAGVTAVVTEIVKVLGDQAGIPDQRRQGETRKPVPVKPTDVADIFVKALEADPRVLKALTAGVPGPTTMPRAYASVVQGCLLIRPLVEKHEPDRIAMLDGLVRGCCRAMIALQLDQGFFKFPDLRGTNRQFGDMIDRLVGRDPNAVRDGWLVVPDPDGGSQYDAGECGIALLRAGAAYKVEEWTRAGLKAADWAVAQPCVPNWNYNAYPVSLLCEAYRATGEKKYLDGVQTKFAVGIAPGQGPNGRWIDPHNARTVNHFVLLRAVQDVEESLPAGKERAAATEMAKRAVKTVLDEAEKLGAPATSHTVQELSRYLRLNPDADSAVRRVLEQAASATVQKCTQGRQVRAAVPLPELAAVGRVWER
jgi:hypothetical protein